MELWDLVNLEICLHQSWKQISADLRRWSFLEQSHCMKFTEIQTFCYLYFLVDGQNRIRTFSYLDRIGDSVQIWENRDTILSICGKIRIRESPYFGLCQVVVRTMQIYVNHIFLSLKSLKIIFNRLQICFSY